MTPFPLKIERRGDDSLLIEWNDGQKRLYTGYELRKACPCAGCKGHPSLVDLKPMELPVLTEIDLKPVNILNLNPVGRYAYSIDFSDGHNTGIYTLDYLHSLGKEVE